MSRVSPNSYVVADGSGHQGPATRPGPEPTLSPRGEQERLEARIRQGYRADWANNPEAVRQAQVGPAFQPLPRLLTS